MSQQAVMAWDPMKAGAGMKAGVVPVHDGQRTVHFDPDHAVGLVGGMAGFDYDFGMEGMFNATFRGSQGETTLKRQAQALSGIARPDEHRPKIEWKIRRDGAEGKQIEEFLQGTIPVGQKTALLDEPDRSLSMKRQDGLWWNLASRLATATSGVQVIAVSHSPFALRLPGVNYIDLVPGYHAECMETVTRMGLAIAREAKMKAAGAFDE